MDTNKTERENHQIVPFNFESHTVRMVLAENESWFIAKDVCDVLEIKQPTRAIAMFPENEKGVNTIHTPGGKQRMLCVNEPGLYRLVFQSRKPEAEQFKAWVFTEVLPSIRRTGMFLPEGMNKMIRQTVKDVITAIERESFIRRGTLLSGEERLFILSHARYPVWRIAALTGRGETTIRRILRTAGPAQPGLFDEAAV